MKNALGGVQTVLVLGGGSDIARATTLALVRERARTVVLAGRRPEHLEDTASQLRKAGATTVEVVAFDACDHATHAGFVEDVWRRVGDVDLVLIAFGVIGDQQQDERDAAAAVDVALVNYVGAVSAGTHVAQRLREQGHGTIVVLSSVAAERPRRSNYVYGSSKAGLDAFFNGMSDSLTGSGVSVMVVRPGFVRTKMTAGLDPAPLSTTPDAVAAAVVDGVRRGSTVVWVPPALRWVMTALRHLPRALFRRLEL